MSEFQPSPNMDNQILPMPRMCSDRVAEDSADLAAARGVWNKAARPGSEDSTATIQVEEREKVEDSLDRELDKILR